MTVALELGRVRVPAKDENFRGDYLQALRLIERLHRLLLDVIKDEFDRVGGAELNSVQALLLYNIGESELTAGELKTRGYRGFQEFAAPGAERRALGIPALLGRRAP